MIHPWQLLGWHLLVSWSISMSMCSCQNKCLLVRQSLELQQNHENQGALVVEKLKIFDSTADVWQKFNNTHLLVAAHTGLHQGDNLSFHNFCCHYVTTAPKWEWGENCSLIYFGSRGDTHKPYLSNSLFWVRKERLFKKKHEENSNIVYSANFLFWYSYGLIRDFELTQLKLLLYLFIFIYNSLSYRFCRFFHPFTNLLVEE